MKVYRIAINKYIDDVSGTGAKLYGGRWNEEGHSMLYCSSNLSLCSLELLANHKWNLLVKNFSWIEIEIPQQATLRKIDLKDLPDVWRQNSYHTYTIKAGSNWLMNQSSLGLIVPSAVLPSEKNVLINPRHADFQKIKILRKEILDLDGRVVQ